MTNTTTHSIINATFAPTVEDVLEFAFHNITANITELPEEVSEEAAEESSKFIGYYTLKSLPFLICEENVGSDYDSDGIYLFWATFMASIFIIIAYELYRIPNPETMSEGAVKFWKYLLYGYAGLGGGAIIIPLCLALVQCSGRKGIPIPPGFCSGFGSISCRKNADKCVWNDSRRLCYEIPLAGPITGIISALIPAILYAMCLIPVFRNEPGEVDWLYLEKHKLEDRKMISLPAIGVMEITDAADVACDALLVLSFMPYPAFFVPSAMLFYMLFGLYNIKRQLIDTYFNQCYNGIYLTRWHHFIGPLATVHQTAMDYIDAHGLVLSHIPVLGCVGAYDLRRNRKFMEPYLRTRFIWFSIMRTFQDLPQFILLIMWVTTYSSGPFVLPVIVIKSIQLLVWLVLILTQFRDKRGLDRAKETNETMGEGTADGRRSGRKSRNGESKDTKEKKEEDKRRKSVKNRYNSSRRPEMEENRNHHQNHNRRNSRSQSGRRRSMNEGRRSMNGGHRRVSGRPSRSHHLYE